MKNKVVGAPITFEETVLVMIYLKRHIFPVHEPDEPVRVQQPQLLFPCLSQKICSCYKAETSIDM